MVKKVILTFIAWYQKNQPLRILVGSHLVLFGGSCKFTPTCSEYTYQAIKNYGVLKGLPRALWRIMRCNPFSKGGIDPL